MMRVLALDIATSCGWAVTPGLGMDQPWRWGCRDFPSKDGLGAAISAFEVWLNEKIATLEPDVIAIERPILPGLTSYLTLRKLYGMAAVAEMTAHDRRIPYVLAQPSTVRKHFCGNGRAKKADVLRSCAEQGFSVTDHNTADAIALACFARDNPKIYAEAA